jgi:hypothetical protein|eukprot:COSAG02_NODE_9528_length_2189_cov_1.312440_2_plen_51_part_00
MPDGAHMAGGGYYVARATVNGGGEPCILAKPEDRHSNMGARATLATCEAS